MNREEARDVMERLRALGQAVILDWHAKPRVYSVCVLVGADGTPAVRLETLASAEQLIRGLEMARDIEARNPIGVTE